MSTTLSSDSSHVWTVEDRNYAYPIQVVFMRRCERVNVMTNSQSVAFTSSAPFGVPGNTMKFEKRAHFVKNGKLMGGGPHMSHHQSVSRRVFIGYLSFPSLIFGGYSERKAAKALSSPFVAPEDLTRRLNARITKEQIPRIYQRDIFYPEYFKGTWKTESTLLAVESPAGYKLFGRPGSFEAAQEEVNNPLLYQSRFVRSGDAVISDRPFNVTSIARASMGASSVLDCIPVGSTPNRIVMTLRPNSANDVVFNVNLRIIARQQQMDSITGNPESQFQIGRREIVDSGKGGVTSSGFGLYTSETMRQEIRLNTEDLTLLGVMPSIKDVETTTFFVTEPRDTECIKGWQKTCVYLAKSDLRYLDAKGRPIDVRWYRLRYFRQ